MSKKSYLLLFTVLVLAGCAQQESNTVKIGCAAPLTGDQAQLGIDTCQGVKLAVEEANQKNLGIPGMKFDVSIMDDQHNPAQAVNVAKRFVSDTDVVGVIAHFNSSCSKPASAIYHSARMTQITAVSTNPELSRQGFDTFFRVCATDDVQGPSGATFAAKKWGPTSKVFIIDDKTTYGKGLSDEFEKAARKIGMNVLGHEGITQGDKDFTPLLTKIKPLAPDFIYFGGIYPEGALMLRQSRDLGIAAPFVGGDGIANPILVDLATPAIAEGTYATMVGGDMKKVPEAQEFIKSYESRFKTELGQWSAYSYDATNILIAAITKAGKRDREAVLKAMREISEFQGVTGKVVFDEKGDNKNQFIGVFEFKNGKLEYVGPAE